MQVGRVESSRIVCDDPMVWMWKFSLSIVSMLESIPMPMCNVIFCFAWCFLFMVIVLVDLQYLTFDWIRFVIVNLGDFW